MALSAEKGTFAVRTTVGSQTVSLVDTSLTPKVLFLWTVNLTAAGFGTPLNFAFGAASSASQDFSIGSSCDDNVASSNTGRRRSGGRVLMTDSNGSGTVDLEIDTTSFAAGNFIVNVQQNVAGTAKIIHYLVLGGSEITSVKVGTYNAPTVTGLHSTTDPGFQPNALFLFTGQQSVSSTVGASMAFGLAKSTTERFYTHWMSDDANAGGNPGCVQRSTACIGSLVATNPAAMEFEADFSSFDATGFTLNWTDAPTATFLMHYVAFKMASADDIDIGVETQRTSTGTKQTTGLSIVPKAVMFLGTSRAASSSIDTGTTAGRMHFGASDGTHEGGIAIHDFDGAVNTQVAQSTYTTKSIRNMTADTTTTSEAGLSAFGSGSFTLNWTTADATAREFLYIVWGDTPSGPPVVTGAAVLSGAGALSATGSLLVASSTLTDNFNDDSIDTAKWTTYSSGGTQSVTEAGANLDLSRTSVNGRNRLVSVNSYDLTGSYVVARLAAFSLSSTLSFTALRVATSQTTLGGSDDAYMVGLQDAAGVTQFCVRRNLNGATDTERYAEAYNASQHVWFRIRESGGTIFFDSSPNGTTWTNEYNEVSSLSSNNVYLSLEMDHGASAGTTTASWDDFNSAPGAVTGAAALTGTGSLSAVGRRTRLGTTTLSGSGSLVAVGVRKRFGAMALSGSGALSASGNVAGTPITGTYGDGNYGSATYGGGTADLSGAAVLSGQGSLAATGARSRFAAAALAGAGALTGFGLRTVVGSASLSGAGALTAAGVRKRFGIAALSGAGALAAVGGRTRLGAVALTGAGALAAIGVRKRFGASALSGAGALSATGNIPGHGAAALTGSGSLTATGRRTRFGAATLTGSGSLVALGRLPVSGAAALSGTGSLSTVGTVTALIAVPIRVVNSPSVPVRHSSMVRR